MARPEYPEVFEYLHQWALELCAYGGEHCSWSTLRDWRLETGIVMTPDEKRAVLRLVAIMRSPGDDKPTVKS